MSKTRKRLETLAVHGLVEVRYFENSQDEEYIVPLEGENFIRAKYVAKANAFYITGKINACETDVKATYLVNAVKRLEHDLDNGIGLM